MDKYSNKDLEKIAKKVLRKGVQSVSLHNDFLGLSLYLTCNGRLIGCLAYYKARCDAQRFWYISTGRTNQKVRDLVPHWFWCGLG